MAYIHLRADCVYTGISSGPNARNEYGKPLPFLLSQSAALGDELPLNWLQKSCSPDNSRKEGRLNRIREWMRVCFNSSNRLRKLRIHRHSLRRCCFTWPRTALGPIGSRPLSLVRRKNAAKCRFASTWVDNLSYLHESRHLFVRILPIMHPVLIWKQTGMG